MYTKIASAFVFAGVLSLQAFGGNYALAQDTVVRIMTTETNEDTKRVFEQIIDEYEQAHEGIDIVPQYVGFQDLNTKLMAAFAAGDAPEIFNIQSNYQAFVLAEKGLIQPVDNVIDEIGRSDYVESVLNAVTVDGNVWVVPFSIGVNVLWYRSDLYDKYGLEAPTTWEIFENNARVITERSKEKGEQTYGLAMTVAENWLTNDNTQNWMWTNGATVYNSKKEVTLDSPEAIATFELLKRLSQYAPPAISTYTNLEMLNSFATGAVAHTEYPFRMLAHLKQSNPEFLEVAVPIEHPRGPSTAGREATFLYAKGWAMAKNSPNEKEAADFLTYLQTGDREIRMLQTVPVHYWPARKSVQDNPKFLDQDLLKTKAGERSIAVLKKAIANGDFPLSASGTTILEMGDVLAERVLAKALQQVIVNDQDPKSVLEESAASLRE